MCEKVRFSTLIHGDVITFIITLYQSSERLIAQQTGNILMKAKHSQEPISPG